MAETPPHWLQGTLHQSEAEYLQRWLEDAKRFASSGFYERVTDMVAPKDDDVIVDIGFGTAHQLVSLMLRNPKSTLIGTDRTSMNVMSTYQRLINSKLGSAFAAVPIGKLTEHAPGQIHWQHDLPMLRAILGEVRELLKTKVLLLPDNILYPQSLPEVLGDTPITAGIMSLPGGSGNRAYEWPVLPEHMQATEQIERIQQVSDQTRMAFYHFMSQHVRPGGRIIVAERITVEPGIEPMESATHNMRYAMGELQNYWAPHSSNYADLPLEHTTVELYDTSGMSMAEAPQARAQGKRVGVVISRFDRNDRSWNSPPLPRPVPLQ